MTSVRVLAVSDGVFALAGLPHVGPENPKGAHPFCPLGYVPETM